MRTCLFSLLTLGATLGAVATEAPTNAPATQVLSRHFRVTGPDASQNAVTATYAEEALAKSARLTGLTIRQALFAPIRIELAVDTNHPEQRVTKFQTMADGLLDQRIRLRNPAHIDVEDFLEALSWLILNRLAVQAQTRLTMPAPPQTPEWLAVGLAQNLFPQYALRNRQVVLRRWQAGQAVPLAEVLNWRVLPEGRWTDKAVCGAAVEWLMSQPHRTALWSALLARTMAGQPITLDWLAGLLPDAPAVRDAEKRWDLWVMHWANAVPALGVLTRQQTAELRDALQVDPGAYDGKSQLSGARLPPEYFIAHRQEIWLRRLAQEMSAKLVATGVGRPLEFQQVLAAYARFFTTLADAPASHWWIRVVHRPPSEKKLRALLAVANQQLADLEKTLDERQRYLDQVTQKLPHAASPPAPPP
jgi:hypothetical protein